MLPRSERRYEATYLDPAVMKVLDQNKLLNLPSLMIKYMTREVNQARGTHILYPMGSY